MAFLRSGCGQPGTFDHGSVSGEKRCGRLGDLTGIGIPLKRSSEVATTAEMVTFGKAHSDRSFAEVWDHYPDCPDWTQWFFAHYQPSKKTEHPKMCLLIKKMIEESENNATYAPTTEASHAMPKRLTHPLIATAKPRPHPLPARVPRFQRPVFHGTQPEINRKPSRICSSEFRALRGVSSRSLRSLATHPDPPRNRPVHLADLLPESPLAEWDDPWNA